MTILEEDPTLASIDSMLDNDHFVCCKVGDNFAGVTTGFCGAPVILDGSDPEWVDEVGCEPCNKLGGTPYCPLGYHCYDEDDEDGED